VSPAAQPPVDPARLRGLPRKGDKIADRYRIEGLIGLGGMGAVMSAMHVELQQRVAVKVMLPHGARHRVAVWRFLREARAASAIQSQHVVRIFDVGKLKNGLPYMVMEYLAGSSLQEVLDKGGPLPLPDAITYLLHACEAVAQAHAAGIVHRDLKPANLFLLKAGDGSPLVKVLDFGISKAEWMADPAINPSLTATTDVVGTPTYMSPEQVRSAKSVDWRADIWSMGAVLYELTTGHPPFWADNLPALAAMIVSDPVTPPSVRRPGLPPELDAVVLRCLAKDPKDRPGSIQDLVHLLEPFVPEACKHIAERIARVGPPNTAMAMPGEPPPELDISTFSSMNTAGGWGTTAHETGARSRVIAATAIAVTVALGMVGAGLAVVLRGGSPQLSEQGDAAAHAVAAAAPEASAQPSAAPPPSTSALAPGASVSASSAASAPKPPKPKRGGPRLDPFDDRY
jgi:serine/threonine-protein kinase